MIMPIYEITAATWANMLKCGARNIRNNDKIVNDLNVFPIPDGDTGENMSLTIEGGLSAIDPEESDLGEMLSRMSGGMLMNARGNSGVILSQFFGGLAKGIGDVNKATVSDLKRGFDSAVKKAYTSVLEPTEGTILTVMREATAYANENAPENASIEEYIAAFLAEAKRSLVRTPDLLPVLKEAGVIDSGGAGLIYIMEGMELALQGVSVELARAEEAPKPSAKAVNLNGFDEESELTFGYCTECLLRLQKKKVDIDAFDVGTMIEVLDKMGNSIVCVKDGSIVKLHIHTMHPGEVFNFCQKFGEFLTLKVENMNLQHTETTIENNYPSPEKTETAAREHKEFAIVAVASGEGICQTFRDLGADEIITGGQTMNPPAESFVEAFKRLDADHIIVLPNNSNIILAARQAAELYDPEKVRVLESKTIGDGYAALSMFDPTLGTIDAVMANLDEAIQNVKTGMVSNSVRESHLNGLDIHEGDYIGICGKDVLSDAETLEGAAEGLLRQMSLEDCSVLICIKGKGIGDDTLEAVTQLATGMYPAIEVYPLEGGQDVYPLILVAES